MSDTPRDDTCAAAYKYLSRYYDDFGFAPTFRQIAKACDIPSIETVHRHLNHLQKDDLVRITGRGAIATYILASKKGWE